MSFTIRAARRQDVGLVAALVQELADYEKLGHEALASEGDFAAALVGETPRVFCEIADVGGEAAGFALWFYSFSTFAGRHGIYLEDLYVRPAFRRRGIADALVRTLAARCASEGLARLEWSVLKWNASAIAFYEGLGAVAMDGWTVYRTSGAALARLGRMTSALGGAQGTRTTGNDSQDDGGAGRRGRSAVGGGGGRHEHAGGLHRDRAGAAR